MNKPIDDQSHIPLSKSPFTDSPCLVNDSAGLMYCEAVGAEEASHIVKCVNMHDRLIEALELAEPRMRSVNTYIADKMAQALAKARGE